MKRMRHILAMAALVLAVVGCGKKVDVSLSPSSADFTPDGGEVEIALTSNGDWQVEASYDWLSVAPTSGNGNATLVVTATPNDGDQTREAQVKVTTKDNEALLAVTQDFNPEPFLRVEPSQITCDRLGGMFDVTVSSNIDWTVSTLPDGITISKTSGTGNANLSLTIAPLQEEVSSREVDVFFAGANMLVPLKIKQSATSGYDVVIDPIMLSFGYEGGTKTINVSCEGSWTVETSEEWISASPASGNGNGQVEVTVTESNVLEQRFATVNFVSTVGSTTVAHVKQDAAPDPHYLTVDPAEFNIGKEGGSRTISIGCDVEWQIEVELDWATVSPMSGSGDATVTLTVEPNLFVEPRVMAIAVVSGNLSQRITVEQAAGDIPLVVSLSPDTIAVPDIGGANVELNVASNTSWYLEASDWISNLPVSPIQGDATVSFIVYSNSAPEPRYGFIRAKHNGEVMDEIVVAQEGKPDLLEVDVDVFDVRPEGAEFSFHITSNQSWTINTDVNWITCDPTSGFSHKDVNVTVAPTMSTHPRTGIIKVTAESGKMVTITINQGY